ncbi:precorrin-2 C(20)-methyltransferase [Clostridium polyendosporum]|uniref:Cobalt-precorrin-2 C(20)-methyltransferase n=1 Tax=Clostridium polyendosporum TaxID=69208 RepID=A0A919VFI5_9CLOT|nr:precorrin-2 C(20)-methyltransferase [Clostridium polyendosporum]GIM28187.1 precorrin-2 C(20)-methyltransferase [Clostridium polyendosporum]
MREFYGVGIGPGDKELITLKGYNTLRNSDYIFIPKSKGESLAGSIVSDYIEGKNIIEIEFPMGESNSDRYAEAAVLINETIKEGQIGAFITLGDPMTYSTYIYLMIELFKFDIKVETIPGITSFNAAAACLNEPITLKGDNFYLCDGQIDDDILKKASSVCILKVNKNKENIINILEENGFKYVYVRRCTQKDEKVLYDKDEILNDNDYMSLIFARKETVNNLFST